MKTTPLLLLLMLAGVRPALADGDRPVILVRPILGTSWVEATLDTPDGSSLDFVPNPTMCFGGKVGYGRLKVSATFGMGGLYEESEYGRSKNFDFEFAYTFRPKGHELVGTFFLHGHEGMSAGMPDGTRYVSGDLTAAAIGFDWQFFFNKDFSWEKSLDDFEPRSGSRGSWLLRSSLGVFGVGNLSDNTAFIPEAWSDRVGGLAGSNYLAELFLSLSGGYAYDWNFAGRWFLTFVTTVGATGGSVGQTLADGTERGEWSVGPSFSLSWALTYVGQTWHGGLKSNAVLESALSGDVQMSADRFDALWFVGMRL